MVEKPNLFLVGAPKAGTSALANFLAQHPEISVSKVKEPNFHNLDMELPRPKSEKEYLDLFESSDTVQYKCDASILYLYSISAAESIKEYNPSSKILVMLRDPVSAAYSWFCQMRYTGNEPISNFEDALAAEKQRKKGQSIPEFGMASKCPKVLFYSEIMAYNKQLLRFFDLFPRENIKVIIHDEFRRDQRAVFASVSEFLDVDPTFLPNTSEVNPRKERRFKILHLVLKKYLAEPSKRFLPLKFRLGLIRFIDNISSKEVYAEKQSESSEILLKNHYKEEIESLSILIEKDLSAWLE